MLGSDGLGSVTHPVLQVAVENFGPIRSGKVALKPLTILVGPNNSGKSYLALLVYALVRALGGDHRAPTGRGFALPDHLDGDPQRIEGVAFGDLTETQQETIQASLRRQRSLVPYRVENALEEYFAVDRVEELVRPGGKRKSLSIVLGAIEQIEPLLDTRMGSRISKFEFRAPSAVESVVPIDRLPDRSSRSGTEYSLRTAANYIWNRHLTDEGFPPGSSYYLPSARSGIMTGAQLYTSMAIDLVRRRGGFEPIEVAPFSGVAGDFLQALALIDSPIRSRRFRAGASKPMDAPLAILENDMFGGQIAIVRTDTGGTSARYVVDGQRLSLQRTSSMIAELAPLDLWLRHVLRPGDLLIIDEPEAHLHPENQRRIARVLVRLVKAGVQVICPTHSSLILHQVSNHLLVARSSPEERQALGFTDDDIIELDDVGVYLFRSGDDGTRIDSVGIDQEFGISEDEFLRVSEAIGEETYQLSVAAMDA